MTITTTTEYTVQVEVADGSDWTEIETYNCTTEAWGSNWTADQVAYSAADARVPVFGTNSTWRIRVWEGYNADTEIEPAHVFTHNAGNDFN